MTTIRKAQQPVTAGASILHVLNHDAIGTDVTGFGLDSFEPDDTARIVAPAAASLNPTSSPSSPWSLTFGAKPESRLHLGDHHRRRPHPGSHYSSIE